MAYTKRTWKYEGQPGAIPLNPANLNHIEDGIEAVDLGKADKVSGATNNNLAALDGSGNLKDSGSKATDFAPSKLYETTSRSTGADKFTQIMKLTAEVNSRACATVNLMQGSARATVGILAVNCHHSDSGGMAVTAYWVFKPSPTIAAYYSITDAIDVRIYIEHVNTYSRVFFAPITSAHGDVTYYELRSLLASVPGATQIDFMPLPMFAATGELAITNGGTGASTVAGARNALGLGNTSGAVPIANGGTGGTDAATARSNLGLGANATGRTNLGFRTYNGNCTVAANAFYGDVTISGVTAANTHIFVNLKDARVSTSGIYPVHGYVTANNNVRVYFSNSTASAKTYPIHILAVG